MIQSSFTFLACLDHAIDFDPPFDLKKRLEQNRETFAQYVVRLLSYSCATCRALPGQPCSLKVATSIRCDGQFHRARARAAKCPVTRSFLEPELDDE